MPVVLIDGVDVCDELVEVTWGLGGTSRTDPVTGNVASIVLRGRYPAANGDPVVIQTPAGHALFTGNVDGVTETVEIAAASNQTRVSAGDYLAQQSRMPATPTLERPVEKLPDRLDALWGTVFQKWPGLTGSARWPNLKDFTVPDTFADAPMGLDLIRDALTASLAFAYQKGDGGLVYGTWEAPPSGLGPVPDVVLDAGPDCGSRATVEHDSIRGLINHWTAGTSTDIARPSSIYTYGEQTYAVPDDVLADPTGGTFPVGPVIADAMQHPATQLEIEVPITSNAQSVHRAQPFDLAGFDGELYSIVGIQHEATLSGWRVRVALDRNPWAVRNVPAPPAPFQLDYSRLDDDAYALGPV